MIADLRGPIALVPFWVVLTCLAFSIWACVDANSKPAEAFVPSALSKSKLTACIVLFTFLGVVLGFAFAIYYVVWVRPKVIAFVGSHPNLRYDTSETSRQFERARYKRDIKTERFSLLTALIYGVGAYLLFGFIGLPTDLQISVPVFTAVMVFALVSEYLQPTPPAFRGSTPPVTLRQIWTNRTTSKGNGRIFTVWYLGTWSALYAIYFAMLDAGHWSPYGTTTHIWLNTAFQMSGIFVGYSVAYRKSARLK
jgi:hypothetical protein